jgi:DNA mismatch repair protein MutS
MILPEIENIILDFDSLLFKFNNKSYLAELSELAKKIDDSIRDDAPLTITEGNIIKEGFVSELDELINISKTGKDMLVALEKKEREKTGIKSLKLKYNKVFGYFIEISKSQIKLVPSYYIRKQTLVNAERYITEELKEFEIKVTGAEEKRFAMEFDIFDDIRKAVAEKSAKIFSVASDISKFDVLFGFAEVAVQNDYVKPDINFKGVIYIKNGRHPVVEKTLVSERFVPNSILLDNKNNQMLIITGPNMSGKSTVLRQTALFVLMTQLGTFVPAEKVSVPVIDKIFTRVGALDNLSAGQSTFMVEMEETANILNNTTNNSLIIIDEIGRGTSTFDGLSIAWAVAEYLHDFKKKGVKTLFATHYHELTALEKTKKRVKNFHITVKENNDEIAFLRKLAKGGTNRSYGIYVAQLAGMPKAVLKKAARVLKNIEKQEHNLNDALVLNSKKRSVSEVIQLSMFPEPKDLLLKEIKSLDVFSMTPIEAINCLNEIKEKTLSVLQKKIW